MSVRASTSDYTIAPPHPNSMPEWNGRPPGANGSGDPEGIPWSRYIDAGRRHWLLIVAVVTLGSLLGYFAARRVMPVYDAEATVWINTTRDASTQAGPIRQQQVLTSASWLALLKSFAIVDPVVRDLKLNVTYKEPGDSVLFRDFEWTPSAKSGAYKLKIDGGGGYVLSAADGSVVERGLVGESMRQKV